VRSILRHREGHRTSRTGWLRAAVLGANDGIVSTASLVVGDAAAGATRVDILLAGVAGAVAGALSMAAGEYVSVSSQADTERADLALERTEMAADEDAEQRELAAIYVRRGLEPALARTVAQQLMAHDALGAHARDELGLSDQLAARPLQAALASAATFAVGALLPILAVMLPPIPEDVWRALTQAGELTGTVDRIGTKVGKQDVLATDPVARTDARVVEVRVKLADSPKAAPLSNLQVEVAIQTADGK